MNTNRSSLRKVKHPYIVRQKGVCGGQPMIAGTRIKVSQIVIYYEKMRYQPDEIIRAHPHLTLAQVHDALSYYYENLAEIDRQIIAERQLIEALRREHPSVLEQKNGSPSPLHR